MFLEYYKLNQDPFGVTPDPRFLYPSSTHREALASLVYGIEARRGFLALIAPPGMGKTTLLFELLDQLRGSARTVFLFQTQYAPIDLIRYLLHDLGVTTRHKNLVDMHEQLNQILLSEMRAGRRFVLVIDEAQNLSEAVLETARLLSDFETTAVKLMQIVFAGQPQLAEKLDRPSLYQLRQRISILCRLAPFTPAETFDYVEHRLRVAGHDGRTLFTPAAMQLIAAHSEGIPRNINNICFNALSIGYATGKSRIGPEIVQEVARDLSLDTLTVTRAPIVVSTPPPSAATSATLAATPAAALEAPPSSWSGPATLKAPSGDWSAKFWAGAVAGMTCALALLALYGAIKFGSTHTGHDSSANRSPGQALEQAADPKTPADSGTVLANGLPATQRAGVAERDSRSRLILHVVQPDETLGGIVVTQFGHWSPTALDEVQKLNPEVANPDLILTGQTIRLPGNAPAAAALPAGLRADDETHDVPRRARE